MFLQRNVTAGSCLSDNIQQINARCWREAEIINMYNLPTLRLDSKNSNCKLKMFLMLFKGSDLPHASSDFSH